MATRAIRVDFSTPLRLLFEGRDTFRIVARVIEAIGMPAEIFGYQRSLIDPYTGGSADEFMFICSAFDFSVYPVNNPRAGQFPAFFRKNFVDVLVPGLAIADQFITTVNDQVCALVNQLNMLDKLATTTTFWCPGPTEDEPDSLESLESLESL